jgi:hypothetical protein
MNPLVISGLFSAAESLIERFFPDPAAKAAATLELAKMQATGELAQLAATTDLAKAQIGVNLAEASNPSVFVSGWRPCVGWVCALSLGYVAILEPVARFVAQVAFGYHNGFPVIDTDLTMQVLLGMLGMAGLRTFDKVKGVGSK